MIRYRVNKVRPDCHGRCWEVSAEVSNDGGRTWNRTGAGLPFESNAAALYWCAEQMRRDAARA